MTPRQIAALLAQRAAQSASIAALALGLTATVFAPLSAQAASLPSDQQVTPKPFDIHVTGITFHPRKSSSLINEDDLPCFDGQPFWAKGNYAYIGKVSEYTGPEKDKPRMYLSGRPIDGRPDEVIEYDPALQYMWADSTDTEKRMALGTLVTVPPSFVGRDMVWSLSVSDPQDPTPDDNVLENVTLPACKG